MKLSSAVDGFWIAKRMNMSAASERKYNSMFRRFIKFMGDCELEKVTSADIRRYLESLRTQHEQDEERAELTRSTIHAHWAVLSSFWTWAEEDLSVPHIIRNKVYPPEFHIPPVNPYTQDDLKRLLESAGSTQVWAGKKGGFTDGERPTAARDVAIMLVLLDTGVRAGELCALTYADYESKRSRLHIRNGKGNKARYVILGKRSSKALWRYLVTRGELQPNSALFATRTGAHLDRSNLYHTIRRIGDRAGVKDVFIHRFRHTFAVEFLRNGGNVFVLKELMGHEKLEQTMRYVKFAEADISAAAKHSQADNWKV